MQITCPLPVRQKAPESVTCEASLVWRFGTCCSCLAVFSSVCCRGLMSCSQALKSSKLTITTGSIVRRLGQSQLTVWLMRKRLPSQSWWWLVSFTIWLVGGRWQLERLSLGPSPRSWSPSSHQASLATTSQGYFSSKRSSSCSQTPSSTTTWQCRAEASQLAFKQLDLQLEIYCPSAACLHWRRRLRISILRTAFCRRCKFCGPFSFTSWWPSRMCVMKRRRSIIRRRASAASSFLCSNRLTRLANRTLHYLYPSLD